MIRFPNFMSITFLIIFSALYLSCSSTKPITRKPENDVIETQKMINRYFHKNVIPKLSNDWKNLKGDGKITFEYLYENDGNGSWVFKKINIDTSTILNKQNEMALKIMKAAVSGTKFITNNNETEKKYFLYWTWPIHFPEGNFDEVKGVFLANDDPDGDDGNDPGCDGNGTTARCFNKTSKTKCCDIVCVGYKECVASFDENGELRCTYRLRCASGGPFSPSTVMH